MASDQIHIITDNRQLMREIAYVSPDIVRAHNAGDTVVWVDTEIVGNMMVSTPRLCFG